MNRLLIGFACSLLIALTMGGSTGPDTPAPERRADGEWPVYGGTKGNTKYSPLDQINRDNVHRLEVAWVYHAGDEGYTIETNPIVVDGVLYATSPSVNALALDAATGEEIWTFDPYADEADVAERPSRSGAVSRGVAYWEDGEDRRIFLGFGPYLYALDAQTGRPVPGFGTDGRVDLLQGLDRDVGSAFLRMSTPGLCLRGPHHRWGAGGRGARTHATRPRAGLRRPDGRAAMDLPHHPPSGRVRLRDVAGGGLENLRRGPTPGAGSPSTKARGLVFFGTGSPSHDHFGADRHGQNLFGNSVVALNAKTGERVWHYQLVHHDLWDYDLPTPPNLVTVEHDGRRVDAAAQVTKMGMLFLFDRETGEPLFPIEERPVPPSEVPGEEAWPTQPFPVRPPPYARQGFKESDITDRTPEAHAFVREHVYERYGDGELFDPPSLEGAVVFPQFNGGTDWGGASFDPETGILYVNASNEPELMQVVPAGDDADFPYDVTGHQPVKDNEGFPISTPPWGTLSAIDLNVGEILWQVPFGTYPGLEDRGLPPTGTFNMGGSVVTAGGLVFLGASMDEKFRAFDKATGEVLWEAELPAGGYATPAVYEVDGRQYVVIAAGGGGKPGTRPGDAYVAFALPTSDADQEEARGGAAEETAAVSGADGARLYETRCASCHQFNGRGVPAQFPPLVGTEWVTGDKGRLIRVVLGGLSGEDRGERCGVQRGYAAVGGLSG